MNCKTLVVLFLLLLASCRNVYSQGLPALKFERIEGLSQNTVYSILKDRQGFLWLATANGLNRYDGMEIKMYKPSAISKKRNFKDGIIRTQMIEDDQGRIWFSSGNGVYSLNKKTDFFESHYISGTKGGPRWSMDPILAEDSRCWGVNLSLGLFEYDLKTHDWISYPVPAGNSIVNSWGVKDKDNNFWFVATKGILFFDKEKKKWNNFFPDKRFHSIGYSAGTLYLETGSELFACDIHSLQLYRVDKLHSSSYPPSAFEKFYTDKNNCVWAGDANGNIYCKIPQTSSFQWRGNINTNRQGSLFPVYSLYVDDNGILWVGADVLGLQKAEINSQRFTIFPSSAKDGKNNALFIHCIYEDENRDIWLGTYRQGLLKLNPQTGNITTIKLPAAAPYNQDYNSVSLIRRDAKGNLWIGDYYHLFVKEKGKTCFSIVEVEKPEYPYQLMKPFSMTEFRDSLFLTTAWGIYSISKTAGKYQAKRFKKRGQGFYYDLFIDSAGNKWVATELGILKMKDFNVSYLPDDAVLFKGTGIKSFLDDTAHRLLWISTTGGLIAYHLPTGKYKNFTEADGLGDSYVYGALQKEDVLWLSTNRGLSRATMIFQKDNALPQLFFTNFSSNDGLPDNEFNTGAFYKGNSGNFYFGSISGAAWFNPDQIKANQILPAIVMTNLLVNEESPDTALAPEYIRHLSLPYFRNNLFFQFRGIEFSNASKVSYAYQLEGWDINWIYSSTLNQVRYNRLPPGKYLFKVKAANSAGAWNENAYTVSIIIRPPFWKTIWFYGLLVLVAATALVLITKYISQRRLRIKLAELERQKELERERQRISREMHDDIGAGLTQIALMSESAKKYEGEEKQEQLEEIAASSRKLVTNMGEIIWSLNPEFKTLDDLVVYIREQLYKMLEYADKEYVIQLPDNGKGIVLSNQQRRNILLIIKEIVNNAVKHSKANKIAVTGKLNDRQLLIEITDNGQGFDIQKEYSGNGLRNIRHRIEELGGRLALWSLPGNTTFSLTIPV